jgi:hypothetical protein
MAFDVTENYTVSVQFTIYEPVLDPSVVVSPCKAAVGDCFVFVGSHFTPDGLVLVWFADPSQTPHELDGFLADSSGGFIRKYVWPEDWPPGVYTFLAFDSTKSFWASVEFEMVDFLAYQVYLPIVAKRY